LSVKRELNRLKEKFEHYMSFMFPKDPLAFFEQNLGFKPTEYQVQLTKFFTENQFVAARWCRQSGKSHIISALLLHYALIHPDTYIAVVGPSWRQTKLIIRRINSFLRKLPKGSYHKPQKTIAHLSNGSIIEAFPNNPETIRGPSLHVVFCLPNYVNVTLADGPQIPISQIKVGQQVLTYNKDFCRVEPKRVLKVFRNPIEGRTFVRVFHDYGYLDCTAEHKVFTWNREYVPSFQLDKSDKVLYLADIAKYKVGAKNKVTLHSESDESSRAADLRWALRRYLYPKTKERVEKCSPCYKSFLKTSGICSIQIFHPKEPCENSAKTSTKQRLGKAEHAILHIIASKVHRNLSNMLFKWTKDHFARMVEKNQLAVRISNLVYGRWLPFKISHTTQHPQIFQARKFASSTMAKKSMGNKFKNRKGYERQRILLTTPCERQGLILRLNQTAHHSLYAIQNLARIEGCSMRNMWQTSSTQKSCSFSGKESCLLKFGMQEIISEIKSRLETQKTEGMRSLRENFHTNARQDKNMFICLPKKLETSAKKISKITKQEAVTPSTMPAMWSHIRPYKRPPENLQYGMSPRTAQKILENTLITKTLRALWQSFLSAASKAKILQCKMSGARALPQKKEKNEIVYNLEVEDNHNFFADGILVSNCDEMNFIQNDEELYDAILFTLSATNGKFICSSTPWSTDSIFYKIFNHEDYADFKRSHVTWRDAVEPEGPLKKATLEKIQRQFQGDPWRWKREMEAEWAENESVWLPQALITSCIDHTLYYIDFNERAKGEFFMGIDLGKHQDHSVISVVMREKNLLKLVHLKRFPLKTAYASVIGYVKTLCDRWSSIQKVSVDMSGVGDYIVEDMQNAGIHGVEGIKFTQPTKEQLATNLKQQMVEGVFKIPYDPDLIAELNVERFELRKTGGISFSHPEGTHDDKFWSVALALHSSRVETPSQLVRAY